MLIALVALAFQRDAACYVQTATAGCRIVAYGETVPLRSLRPAPYNAFLQAPAGGSLVVVFRESGARFRLDGLGQAKVGEAALLPVGKARVSRLKGVDTRLTATGDRRFGSRYAAGLAQASGPAGWGEGSPALPEGPVEAVPPFKMPPPLTPPVEPKGVVREEPREIRIHPAPPDGPVTVRRADYEKEREEMVARMDRRSATPWNPVLLKTRMRNGVIELPSGVFTNDDFREYVVLDAAGKQLARLDARVMTPPQRAELERTERLAMAKDDDESLGALALLYEDLRMPRDADRIYRRLLVRHPDDLGLRDKVSGKEED